MITARPVEHWYTTLPDDQLSELRVLIGSRGR